MRKIFCGTSGSSSNPKTHKLSDLLFNEGLKDALLTHYGYDILLRPAQDEALFSHNVLNSKDNVIISTPTNSGKSLLSYLLLFQEAAEGRTAILVEPLRALAYEKTEDIKNLSEIMRKQSGIRIGVTITTGDYRLNDEFMHSAPRNPDGSAKGQIIIATPERLDALSRVKENKQWFERVALICFDEAHLLGDPQRGATMELLIAFLRSLKTDLRIILMSATISNTKDLAEWLAPCDVVSDIPRYPTLDKWLYCVEDDEDVDEVLINEILKILQDASSSVLVFVYQTASAEKLALALARRISGKNIRQHDLDAAIRTGVAWFYSKLSSATKNYIVEAMNSGKIRVAVSTTALSMGINLPATHVFVRDISFTGFGDLDVSDLMQMIGRAGRGDKNGIGVVLLSKNNLLKETEIVSGLKNETVPSISSQLIPKEKDFYYGATQDDMVYLDRIGNQVMGILNRYGNITLRQFELFLSSTFGGSRFENLSYILSKLIDWKLAYLNEDTNEYELTHLGKVSSICYIPPLTAANMGQLIRDLLEDAVDGRHIANLSPIDYLIMVCLVSDENKPMVRFSKALESKVHDYMESLPLNEKSYLYSSWIMSSPEALFGSARINSVSKEAKKKTYQATFTAMFIYDISRGYSHTQLEAYYGQDAEERQERIRDNVIWILNGLEQILKVKSFYYHLKENCHAEQEQINMVDNAFKTASHAIFVLMDNLKFRSPLGEMIRSIKNVYPNADSYPGEGTIRKLEAAGISSVKDLVGKTNDALISIGVRKDYAELITEYIRKRMS